MGIVRSMIVDMHEEDMTAKLKNLIYYTERR